MIVSETIFGLFNVFHSLSPLLRITVGGDGYVEDGREIFDDDLDEESIKKESKKRGRSNTQKHVEPPKGNIERMLANMPSKRKREVSVVEDTKHSLQIFKILFFNRPSLMMTMFSVV